MMDMKKEKEPIRQTQGELGGLERVSLPDEQTTVETFGNAQDKSPKSPEQNLETLSWMEKIEKKFARVPNDTSDVTDDTVVIQQPQTQQPPVTLPITQQQMQVGKSAKPSMGIAWLVTWVIRKIKIISKSGRQMKYRDIPEIEKQKSK